MKGPRALVAALAVVVAVAGCSGSDSYPLLASPGGASWVPVAIGRAVRGVVLYVQLRPGDEIEFVSAEPIGLGIGADAAFYFARPVRLSNGVREIGDTRQALAGAAYAPAPASSYGPDTSAGIVAEVTAHKSGIYTLTGVRLTFRLNGGGPQTKEGISELFTVCAADPAPANCDSTPSD